jgi:hypothetical protein
MSKQNLCSVSSLSLPATTDIEQKKSLDESGKTAQPAPRKHIDQKQLYDESGKSFLSLRLSLCMSLFFAFVFVFVLVFLS